MRRYGSPASFMIAVISCAALLLLPACSLRRGARGTDSGCESQVLIHTVSADGETLSAIALWYTGDVKNWRSVYVNAQSGKLTRLRTGDSVLIPRTIVIRPGPVPSSLFRRSGPRNTSTGASKPNGRSTTIHARPDSSKTDPTEDETAAEEQDAEDAQNDFLSGLVQLPRSDAEAGTGTETGTGTGE